MFYHALDRDSALALLEPRHAAELFDLVERNRERLAVWLPWVAHSDSVERTAGFIRHALRQFAENNGFHAGIWHAGRLAGAIGFHAIDWIHRSTSLGYWLGEQFEGRGLVTRACRALIDHAFGSWQLERVEIRCATGNARSRAVPERLGFVHEGTARGAEQIGERRLDLELYGMLAADWPRTT